MSEAADDLFDAAMQADERRKDLERAFKSACPCQSTRWVSDEDGIWECQVCESTFEL